jgi:hypothetical protein
MTIQLAHDAPKTTTFAQTMMKTGVQPAKACSSTRARLLGLMAGALLLFFPPPPPPSQTSLKRSPHRKNSSGTSPYIQCKALVLKLHATITSSCQTHPEVDLNHPLMYTGLRRHRKKKEEEEIRRVLNSKNFPHAH